MADELTRMNPGIARLAAYYRHPLEKREGEGMAHRIFRTGLQLATMSKQDYDAAQMAKERLFMANVQLNQMKEQQKLEKQKMDVYSQEAMARMKNAHAKAERARASFNAAGRMGNEATAAMGGLPFWASSVGQEYYRSAARAAGAKSGDFKSLLDTVSKLQAPTRKSLQDMETGLDKQLVSLQDPTKRVGPEKDEAIGRYISDAYATASEYSKHRAPVEVEGYQIPSTVQNKGIEQHYGSAQAMLGKYVDTKAMDSPEGYGGFMQRFGIDRDTTIGDALRKKLAQIRQATGAQAFADLMPAAETTIADFINSGQMDDLIVGMGGPEKALELLRFYVAENPQKYFPEGTVYQNAGPMAGASEGVE